MGLKATVAEDSRDPGGEAPLPGLSTGWECSLDLAGVGEGIWVPARVQGRALGPTDRGSNPSAAAASLCDTGAHYLVSQSMSGLLGKTRKIMQSNDLIAFFPYVSCPHSNHFFH